MCIDRDRRSKVLSGRDEMGSAVVCTRQRATPEDEEGSN